MKIMVLLGKLVLGFVALNLLAAAVMFGWWQFGDWQARAQGDVTFLHDTIATHHPGPVDPENPAFRTQMDEAYARAMDLADDARSPADHHAALRAYVDSFNDGHLTIFFAGDALARFNRASQNPASLTDVTGLEILDGGAWIRIPSFTERRASIAALTEEIEVEAERLRTLETVVFDLRGNGGGDSSFANRIAAALWSVEVYRDWVPASARGVDWRATPANAEHVHAIAQRHADNGRERNAAAWTQIAQSLDAAVEAGEPYARQTFRVRDTTRTAASPVTAWVIAITDGACASACLDFMDKLMVLRGVVHVGEETSSDTQYIDVRRLTLPSRTGGFVIPLKVYRDRLRPAGGTYVPQIALDPEDLTPADLESLVARIEASTAGEDGG